MNTRYRCTYSGNSLLVAIIRIIAREWVIECEHDEVVHGGRIGQLDRGHAGKVLQHGLVHELFAEHAHVAQVELGLVLQQH